MQNACVEKNFIAGFELTLCVAGHRVDCNRLIYDNETWREVLGIIKNEKAEMYLLERGRIRGLSTHQLLNKKYICVYL